MDHTHLRDRVMEYLPENTRDLWREIEAFAGLRIEVAMNTRPAEKRNTPFAPAISNSASDATIYVRRVDPSDAAGIAHELLHLHRYWIDAVPAVLPVRGEGGWYSQRIESAIEHLKVVPGEQALGFDSRDYWNSVARSNWSSYPWRGSKSMPRRMDLLLFRLALNYTSDPGVGELARSALQTEGLLGYADRFNETICQLSADKAQQVAHVLHSIRIPADLMMLVHFDVRKREAKTMPVPRRG